MANKEHLEILKQGVNTWNTWREKNPEVRPDLSRTSFEGAPGDLYGIRLPEINLRDSNLSQASFRYSYLINANLSNSDLTKTDFNHADLRSANFKDAILKGANLADADVRGAEFCNASLRDTDLWGALFNDADLSGADLSNASVGNSSFNTVDLSMTIGLDTLTHLSPSTIGIDTIYLSQGQISEIFLRGAGVPDNMIEFVRSLAAAEEPIQFYSCFISYSGKDEDFAKRLYSRLRDEQLRIWFAPEDIKGGEKLREQIDRAIQVHDRLLVVLSANSLRSKWVETEIRKARKVEMQEKRRKLFPIRLASYAELQEWECFDSDTGEDLAREVREYFIPDFSGWKKHDSFEDAFSKLMRDLRTENNS